MCRTVIKNVLAPLVAKYGQSIGLWGINAHWHTSVIEDEDFIDYLEQSFHEDFKLVSNHCQHMRKAIATIKKQEPTELNVWIDRKLGEYLTLKTVVGERLGEKPDTVKLRAPPDKFAEQHDIAAEILA